MASVPTWFQALVHLVLALPGTPGLALLWVAIRFREWDDEGRLWLAFLAGTALQLALLAAGRRIATALWREWTARALAGVAFVVLGTAFVTATPDTHLPSGGKRVAVVGGGAAGVHAAWLLDRLGADVTLFEAATYLGGHAQTFTYTDDHGASISADMGYIFGPLDGYEEFKALLAYKDVSRTHVTLDLSATSKHGSWASGGVGLEDEVRRFQALAQAHYDDPSLNLVPFDRWLDANGFDQAFRDTYLTPPLILLFITDEGMYQTSTRFVLTVMAGPRSWLDFDTGGRVWAIDGGSQRYYDKMQQDLVAQVRLATPVHAIERTSDGVRVRWRRPDGTDEQGLFDDVVLAVPANVARRLLVDRTWFEDAVLAQVKYTSGEVLLHTDARVLPEDPSLQRVYRVEVFDHVEVHALPEGQLAPDKRPPPLQPRPFMTLNPSRDYEGVVYRRTWKHYSMDLWHLVVAHKLLPLMQGAGGVHYAGDWVRFMGHGPSMRSGMRAACEIAGTTPRPGLSSEGCKTVTLIDPAPELGLVGSTVTLCGEQGVVDFLVKTACTGSPDKGPAAEETR